MKRRDITQTLLASAAGAALAAKTSPAEADMQPRQLRSDGEQLAGVTPTDFAVPNGPSRYGAKGDNIADDTLAWSKTCKVNGYHFVADGTYKITSKLQTSAFLSMAGATRQNTILRSAGFADYLLEVGSVPLGPNPNVGLLQRMRFLGTSANTGLLHMNQLSHMWRLDELLFQSSPCPALVIDNCWDSNYTNIDILACGAASGADPAVGAMVIIRNGCNNLYLRGLRLEHGPVGALYVGSNCDPIYLISGKIDQGFIRQYAAAVTVAAGGILVMDDLNITGVNGQYVFDVAGSLLLGNVSVYGGTGRPAINDTRPWAHINPVNNHGAARSSFGPIIQNLHLGTSQFYRGGLSINQNTLSVVHSKIFPVRLVTQLEISANGMVVGDAILVQTNLISASNHLYENCYLVHNPTGTHAAGEAGARRKILTSFSNGQCLVQGRWPCTTDSDWSIEYCGGHFTPNFAADGVLLDQGMDLFTVLQTGIRIINPKYNNAKSPTAPGATLYDVTAPNSMPQFDAAGYFLTDEITGEPYLISHGVTSSAQIAVMYDCASTLDVDHTFAVVAGYFAGVSQRGNSFEWTFAGERKSAPLAVAKRYGFDIGNIPLWGIGNTDGSVHVLNAPLIDVDAPTGGLFIIEVADARGFTINPPLNLPRGGRILIMVRNVSSKPLGTITWHRKYRLASWSSPAAACSRTIEFMFDGSNLIEVGRTPSDVPN